MPAQLAASQVVASSLSYRCFTADALQCRCDKPHQRLTGSPRHSLRRKRAYALWPRQRDMFARTRGGWPVKIRRILEIYVAPNCFGCDPSLALAPGETLTVTQDHEGLFALILTTASQSTLACRVYAGHATSFAENNPRSNPYLTVLSVNS